MEREGVGVDDALVALEGIVPVGVVLGPGEGVAVLEAVRAGVGVGSPESVVGGCGGNADVGELAVVGGSEWVQADEVQGVGVDVVAGIYGDDGGGEVGLHERVVVAAHGRETHGVLVDEGGGLHWVVTGEGVGDEVDVTVGEFVEHGDGVLGGVVGVVSTDGGVSGAEEQSLDGVRETDVVRWVGGGDGRVGLERSDLYLLNQNITGSTAHAFTLVVGHDGVVGPYLHDIELRRYEFAGHIPVGVAEGSGEQAVGEYGVRHNLVLVKKVLPVTEDEVDAHLIVRKSSGGESHTTVTRVEQG